MLQFRPHRGLLDDDRIGWHHTHYVCVKRYGPEKYDYPQCVGMVNFEDKI
jgi:hypothetical protein